METVSLSKKLQKEREAKKTSPKSQKYRILKYLLAGHSITPCEALGRFKCFRLADVVYKLKKQGYDIKTTLVRKHDNSGHYARYTLIKKK